MMLSDADPHQDVTLRVPCLLRFGRIVRTAAAACAVLENFSIDGLSDVRLVVDEVFNTMYELGVDVLEVRIRPHDSALDIEMCAVRPIAHPGALPDLRIVQAVVGQITPRATVDLTTARPTFAATMVRS